MIKTLIKLIVLLIVVLIAGGVVGFIYIDSIAKAGIEKGGTYALGVDTTVDSADVEILAGEFSMKGLNVANPSGFDSPHFLNLKNGNVEVSLTTLMSDVVSMSQLKFGGLDVNLQKREGKTNYGTILDNLKRFESSDDKSPKEGDDAGKRFIVDKLVISKVNVHADLIPEGGELTKVELPIERIALKDVGKKEGGLTLAELSKVVVQAVIEEIVKKGGDILPAALIGDLRSQLAGLTDLSAYGIDVESALPGNIKEVLDKQGIKAPNLDEILGGDGGILGGDDE